MNDQELETLVTLARRLPEDDDRENLKRIHHTQKYGHLIVLKEQGKIVGYAEGYRMDHVPDHPVLPLPKDNPDGKYVYCWAAVCEPGYLRKLIQMGKRTFKDCDWICWHTSRKNNRLHAERISHV